MLNNSAENQKRFEAWADPESYNSLSWHEIDIETRGKMNLCKTRSGAVYAIAQTQSGNIAYMNCSADKCGRFTEIPVLNANSHKASGSIYMVDFADGRIAWFAISEEYQLLCCVTDSIDRPVFWKVIGASVFGKPYPLARSYGGIQIFVRDITNGVSHRWYTDEGWSDWESLYGHISGDVTSADNKNDLPVLLVRGPENAIWAKEHLVPNGWGEWHCLGGQFREDPVALTDAEKTIWAFAVDFENKINVAQILPDASLKSHWQQLSGPVAGMPACACANGIPIVAAVAADGSVVVRRYESEWSDWISLGLSGIAHLDLRSDGETCVVLAQDKKNRIFIRCISV